MVVAQMLFGLGFALIASVFFLKSITVVFAGFVLILIAFLWDEKATPKEVKKRDKTN